MTDGTAVTYDINSKVLCKAVYLITEATQIGILVQLTLYSSASSGTLSMSTLAR